MPKVEKPVDKLIERCYWALCMNALEPLNEDEKYSQPDIESLIEELREFLHG